MASHYSGQFMLFLTDMVGGSHISANHSHCTVPYPLPLQCSLPSAVASKSIFHFHTPVPAHGIHQNSRLCRCRLSWFPSLAGYCSQHMEHNHNLLLVWRKIYTMRQRWVWSIIELRHALVFKKFTACINNDLRVPSIMLSHEK